MSLAAALFNPPPIATFRGRWELTPITPTEAMELFVRYHYLHRRGPCSIAFGLTDTETGNLEGAIAYGTPSSAPLRSGIAGPEHASNVIELTRLYIADHVPPNAESFLIGNSVRRCQKEIVVSFADPTVGHVGTVYQATNWLYTGLSAARTDWTVEGLGLNGSRSRKKQLRASLLYPVTPYPKAGASHG